MAIQANQTVKGAVINNAYIKIQRINVQGIPRPAKGTVPAGTVWGGNLILGIFANKTLADASPSNAIDTIVLQVPNVLTLPTGNPVAAAYAYLLTLPQFAGATSV